MALDLTNTGLLALVSDSNVMLGRIAVASLSDGSREAEVYSTRIQAALDDLTMQSDWNFASTTVALVNANVAPVDPRFPKTFTLPADLMRWRYAMNASGSRLGTGTYILEGGSMLTSEDAVLLKYVRALQTVDLIGSPIWFRELFVARLAMEAAEGLTGQPDLFNRMVQLTMTKFRTASVADGQSEPLTRVNADTLLTQAHRGMRTY